MGKLQQYLSCISAVKNTGQSASCLNPKHARHILAAPKGAYLTVTEIANLQATLKTKTTLDDKSLRWFDMGLIAAIEDKSEDPVSENVQLHGLIFVRDGFKAQQYRYVKGGNCMHLVRESFNYLEDLYDIFVIDAGKMMWGIDTSDSLGNPVLGAMSLGSMFAFKKLSDGNNPEMYFQHIGWADPAEWKNQAFVQLGFNYDTTIAGLKQVSLQFDVESASNVFKVKAFTGCNSVDMVTSFGAAMTATYWTLTNTKTGATITKTVAANPTGWTITPDTGDTDYPAVGETMTLTWAAPSGLPSPLTGKYEADTILIARTA